MTKKEIYEKKTKFIKKKKFKKQLFKLKNIFSYAVLPVKTLNSINVNFKTSSDRDTYILFSIGTKLVCALVDGRFTLYIEENGVLSHVSLL